MDQQLHNQHQISKQRDETQGGTLQGVTLMHHIEGAPGTKGNSFTLNQAQSQALAQGQPAGAAAAQQQNPNQNKEFVDVEKKVLRLLNQRYELKEPLGKGAHGQIYSGRDKITKQPIAVKVMEKISKNKSKYNREISLMKDMNKNLQTGFPRLIYHSSDKLYYYIVMELLHACLKDLKDQQEERVFSLKTVTMIGLQTLQRLESIHKFGYVHRDLKPANIMVGKNSKGDPQIIYLIDFGLTKKQTQASNVPHGDNQNKVVGTAVYAAINAHMPGSNYYKKDDLESLMYVLLYLVTGSLPWKNLKPTDVGLEKMMKMKMKMSAYDLFGTLPSEFSQIMDNIKATAPDSNPDYRFIEGLFKQIAQANKFKIDNKFDWMVPREPKVDPNSQLGKAVAGAMSSALGQQAVLVGINKGQADQKQRQSVLVGSSQGSKLMERRQSVQNANNFGLAKFNEAFMSTLGLGQKQDEGAMDQSFNQQPTNPLRGDNTMTMTINMDFSKKQEAKGDRKMTSEKLKLDNYLKYAQKSADCVITAYRQEKDKNPHETAVVLQVIEENENSIQGDQQTSQQKNSEIRQPHFGEESATAQMYENLMKDRDPSNTALQNPHSVDRSHNVAQTSATRDLSQNTKLPGNMAPKSLMFEGKIADQTNMQTTTLEARLPAAISAVNQPVSSSGSKNPASSQGGTAIKRQKLLIFGGKKKVSKHLHVPGGSKPREGSEEPPMSFIGLQHKQTKSNIDISINPQQLRDNSEEHQVGQDIPASADMVIPQKEKKEKKKKVNRDATPTFQQDDMFTKHMSNTAHAVVGRKSSQILQGQQQANSHTGQILEVSKKDMNSIEKQLPNEAAMQFQISAPPQAPQVASSIVQQVQHKQSQDGQLDIKVTVNISNNQVNGVGLEAIGGGTLGNDKGSDGQEARNGGSANLSNAGNIVQIVLVTRNGTGGNAIDRQNSQMRNVQVHITSSNQQAIVNNSGIGVAAVPVAGAQSDHNNNAVGSVYNLALNNNASRVVEDMQSQTKLNLEKGSSKVKDPPSGVGAQRFAELGSQQADRVAQSHSKLAARFPPLPEEEAKDEKDTPKIGDKKSPTQEETNTFDEFQKGILSERKSRFMMMAQQLQDQINPGSPANVSRQIAEALGMGQNNKTDDINQVSLNNRPIDLSRQLPGSYYAGGQTEGFYFFKTHSNEDRMKGKIVLPPKTSAPMLQASVRLTSQDHLQHTHK